MSVLSITDPFISGTWSFRISKCGASRSVRARRVTRTGGAERLDVRTRGRAVVTEETVERSHLPNTYDPAWRELLPPRLTTREVLVFARFSSATLRRRIRSGRFPSPVERGIYMRDDVLSALGITAALDFDDPFQRGTDAFHKHRIATKRRAPKSI